MRLKEKDGKSDRMKSAWSAKLGGLHKANCTISHHAIKHFGVTRADNCGQLSRSWEMRRNILYSTQGCIHSRRLVWLLNKAKLNFEEADMKSKESRIQLKSMGISELDSPLLVMDDNPLRFLSSNDINSMADKNLLALVR